MATLYQMVAKAALMQWFQLSENDANTKIQTESVEELEEQVHALGSMNCAVDGIAKQINLSEGDKNKLFVAAVYGPENDEIFETVREKIYGLSDEQKLNVLSTIHDGWVVDNSSEKAFNKKVERNQLRQYVPLDIIGWNEVKSDLLFLNPILGHVGVPVDEEALSKAYHARVAAYFEKMNINSREDLVALILSGRGYYEALPVELAKKLSPMSETIVDQLIKNWNEKDQETAQIFAARQQQMADDTQFSNVEGSHIQR